MMLLVLSIGGCAAMMGTKIREFAPLPDLGSEYYSNGFTR